MCTNSDWAEVRAQGPPFELPAACAALELMGVALGDDGVALLAGLLPASPQLQRLELTMVGMSPAGAKHLARALAPVGRGGQGGKGAKLAALKVETCSLGDAGVEALADALAGIQKITTSQGNRRESKCPGRTLAAATAILHAKAPRAVFAAFSNPPLMCLLVLSKTHQPPFGDGLSA